MGKDLATPADIGKGLAIPAATLPTGNIEAYISAAFQLPMLSAEQEYLLATRFRQHQDLEAARNLVLSHLRFVIKVAKGYTGYGLALPDLIQEGTVGLMKAVRRFDPDMGVRLVSFAVHWIKAEIHEFVLRNWRIVKVATTKAQRKLFFNLRGSKKRLGWFSREEVEDVAEELGVNPETVVEMERRLNNQDMAFDGWSTGDGSESPVAPAACLPDMRMEPATRLEQKDAEENDRRRLYTALASLDARSRAILEARWLSEKKATLHQLAAEFGVSAERIRQIEKAAMNKIRHRFLA